MKINKKVFLVVVVYFVFLLLIFINSAKAHEYNGWQHAQDGINNIIGQKMCGVHISLFFRDMDKDGIIDKCTGAIFTHNFWHVKPFKMSMERDLHTGEMLPSCSCEHIEHTN